MPGFTLSSGIGRIPNIERFLDVTKLSRNPLYLVKGDCNAVYSWGSKPYSVHSERLAQRFRLSHIRLEDGFICSFGKSIRPRKYSLVADPVGIYYDATAPSRLENLLNGIDAASDCLNDVAMQVRAKNLISRIVHSGISKYNYLPGTEVHTESWADQITDRTVLVVDQTVGDQSVRLGGMDQQRFDAMLDSAIREHGAEQVIVKVHPDVLAGKKQGYLAENAATQGVRVIGDDLPATQLSTVNSIYVGTSLLGMEALLHGGAVRCFGQPFYAGWGLTTDEAPHSRRTESRALEQLFIAAYLLYPRYVDPVSGDICELEQILDHIELQFAQRRRVKRRYTCVGITPWKKRYINQYLQSQDFAHRHWSKKDLLNVANDVADESESLLVWGRKSEDSAIEMHLQGRPVARMEDGFLRSVGLGSNFTAPRSLVVDDLGIYFDATRPSRLEVLLQNYQCSESEKARAAELINTLKEQRISKYVSANDEAGGSDFYRGKQVLLVIGQVEGDASLRFGTTDVRSNLELLQAVRASNPKSIVVYKPHPDVVSGNRDDGIDNYGKLSSLCDRVEIELPIQNVMHLCEEIHTMTSLAGMEALLWGKKVVTYGRPFYAGWGLTADRCQFERRQRKLTLQELVYISYVEYPAYLDIESGEFTSVEKTIDALVEERLQSAGSLTATGLEKYANIVRNIRKGLTYAA